MTNCYKLTDIENSVSTALETLMFTSSPTTFTRSLTDLVCLKAASRGLGPGVPLSKDCAVDVLRDLAKNMSWQQILMACRENNQRAFRSTKKKKRHDGTEKEKRERISRVERRQLPSTAFIEKFFVGW